MYKSNDKWNFNKEELNKNTGKLPFYINLLLSIRDVPILRTIIRKIIVILLILGFLPKENIKYQNEQAEKYYKRKFTHDSIWKLYILSCLLCLFMFIFSFLCYSTINSFDIFVDEIIEKILCNTLLSPIYIVLIGIFLSLSLSFYKKHFIKTLEFDALNISNVIKTKDIDLKDISIIQTNKNEEKIELEDGIIFNYMNSKIEIALLKRLNKNKNQLIAKIELPEFYDFKTIIKHKKNNIYDESINTFEKIYFLYPELAMKYEIYTTNTKNTMNQLTVGFVVGLLALSKKQNRKITLSIENNTFNIQVKTSSYKLEFDDIQLILDTINILNLKKYFKC